MKRLKNLSISFFILLLCILCNTGVAQRTFIRKTENIIFPYSPVKSLPTNDGGVILAGCTYAPISSERAALFLIKYNVDGDIEWAKTYMGPGSMTSITLTADKDAYVISGCVEGVLEYKVQFALKTDLNGNTKWCKSYHPSGAGLGNSYDLHVLPNSDIVFDNISLISGGSGDQRSAVCKLDANGNIKWSKFYDKGPKYGYSMLTSDGNILFERADVLTMLNPSGKIIWSTKISGISEGTKPIEINSKKIVLPIHHTTTNTFSLLCLNALGTILWQTELFPGFPTQVINTTNGNILVATGSHKLFLFDQSGNFIKMNQVNSTFGVTRFGTVSEVCGNNYMGFSTSSNTLYAYKINSDLKSLCSDTSFFSTLPPSANTISAGEFVEEDINYVTEDINLLQSDFSLVIESVCEKISCEKVNLGRDTIVCGAASFNLNTRLGGLSCGVERKYKWSTGDTTSFIDITKTGRYWLEVSENNCQNRDTIDVLFDYSSLNLGRDLSLCSEKSETKELSAKGFMRYEWQPTGETTSSITISKPGVYSLSAQSILGCEYRDTIVVLDECPPKLFMPQAFSPNGDGVNDVLVPSGNYLSDYQFRVFNRWGNVVFESNELLKGWNGKLDGKPAPEGIYVWTIDYSGSYNNTREKKSIKGTVVLIR